MDWALAGATVIAALIGLLSSYVALWRPRREVRELYLNLGNGFSDAVMAALARLDSKVDALDDRLSRHLEWHVDDIRLR
ncbi:MAG: hypothetical protein IRZ06_10120 [Nevskia sp.]|nr:hypothetical protein [Nevskia sp.]